jgi:hypothetical protein
MKMDNFSNSSQIGKCGSFKKASGFSVPQIKPCKLMYCQDNEEEVVVWRLMGVPVCLKKKELELKISATHVHLKILFQC